MSTAKLQEAKNLVDVKKDFLTITTHVGEASLGDYDFSLSHALNGAMMAEIKIDGENYSFIFSWNSFFELIEEHIKEITERTNA